ncbi:helix-turn-helix domain-containing protein [Gordonia sp. (in: high G+C Gram-positive bacteria)]|jgi:predicted DNA-binding transcriptional regulator AlpA|uniref:helix-turn-helix transcriptional regulator n=1 Tax=Gordonia sp. (in: high G+C Gram-positive bacteria) TaxID=84139 RepID=UPI001DC9DE34|nr:helix-turn-helix domain-containing protein [Gordonia sp. (in: high G+C Gram-positive bacteria)]MCB1293836.1 helix-turn-helix domain-containing protein [Gordonia sp. (in: high G+C Gram-positive bacteria)]HMS75080.1 helix-turn-helix domain-containing protein [Gordonia sp. (in: high G+C Gram-positive bacteria)]HQV17858.1 helix-turn-helix domain-containing protein [Gordonia sp. (in: high G+C Gram-positive bacteria)]
MAARRSAPTTAPDPNQLLTEEQFADLSGFGLEAVRRWRKAGTGPKHLLISSRWIRYRRSDVDAWMEAQTA